jgi:hypothetical protein
VRGDLAAGASVGSGGGEHVDTRSPTPSNLATPVFTPHSTPPRTPTHKARTLGVEPFFEQLDTQLADDAAAAAAAAPSALVGVDAINPNHNTMIDHDANKLPLMPSAKRSRKHNSPTKSSQQPPTSNPASADNSPRKKRGATLTEHVNTPAAIATIALSDNPTQTNQL